MYIKFEKEEKLKALRELKIWIEKYAIGTLVLAPQLDDESKYIYIYIYIDYSFSVQELNELLSKDMPKLERLFIGDFEDEAIQIVGERLSNLRVNSLSLYPKRINGTKGYDNLCTGIALNDNLKTICIGKK